MARACRPAGRAADIGGHRGRARAQRGTDRLFDDRRHRRRIAEAHLALGGVDVHVHGGRIDLDPEDEVGLSREELTEALGRLGGPEAQRALLAAQASGSLRADVASEVRKALAELEAP